jgi:hypothetical protein
MKLLRNISHRYDEWKIEENEEMTVKDARGVKVVYESALDNLNALEMELLKTASFFVNKRFLFVFLLITFAFLVLKSKWKGRVDQSRNYPVRKYCLSLLPRV